ncbi:uncharacterized protein EV154DRAFT_481875 [Mucor mucedo]|uniref:uncharacterized protein n=1 Tax=Mucor mucedo TaxID=29922 RepID=UPI002220CDFA|nr:uncharacterized protein EV154DRAFT_481875 [Mucor mucedo]KAI7890747.1 hypothetical protein EV154DRAFT_481875 [Mucor mucedo]
MRYVHILKIAFSGLKSFNHPERKRTVVDPLYSMACQLDIVHGVPYILRFPIGDRSNTPFMQVNLFKIWQQEFGQINFLTIANKGKLRMKLIYSCRFQCRDWQSKYITAIYGFCISGSSLLVGHYRHELYHDWEKSRYRCNLSCNPSITSVTFIQSLNSIHGKLDRHCFIPSNNKNAKWSFVLLVGLRADKNKQQREKAFHCQLQKKTFPTKNDSLSHVLIKTSKSFFLRCVFDGVPFSHYTILLQFFFSVIMVTRKSNILDNCLSARCYVRIPHQS